MCKQISKSVLIIGLATILGANAASTFGQDQPVPNADPVGTPTSADHTSHARTILSDRASPDPTVRAKAVKADLSAAITEDLKSGDADQQGEAIAILKDPKTPWNRHSLYAFWPEPLLAMKQYDLIVDLSDRVKWRLLQIVGRS